MTSAYDVSWNIVRALMRDRNSLIAHQLEGFNELVSTILPQIVEGLNPIRILNDYSEARNDYDTELRVYFGDVRYNPPMVHENNGCTKPMLPSAARQRNMTYSSNITVSLTVEVVRLEGQAVHGMRHTITNIKVGKLPVMLGSQLCTLQTTPRLPYDRMGECPFDRGGYFVINGSEKAVVTQERSAYNRVCCHRGNKTMTKYLYSVEIRSMRPDGRAMPKQCAVRLLRKTNMLGYPIYVTCSRFRQDIPLFVMFRALGIESDQEVFNLVLDERVEEERCMQHLLLPSLGEVSNSKITTQSLAQEYLAKFVHITGHPRDIKITADRRILYVREVLANDLLPHVEGIVAAGVGVGDDGLSGGGASHDGGLGDDDLSDGGGDSPSDHTVMLRKATFIGRMVRQLLLCHLGVVEPDDRDNLRMRAFDTSGVLLANLIRGHFSKLVKDMRNSLMKEMATTNWSRTHRLTDLISDMNIHKIIKSNTVESPLRYALSTGNFFSANKFTSSAASNKVGVAQVLNRQSYMGTLSHLRRLHASIDKNNCKLTKPRQCKGGDFGFIGPCETPEGGSIGAVKNLAICTTVTGYAEASLVVRTVIDNVMAIEDALQAPGSRPYHRWVHVLVNNNPLGVTREPRALYRKLRDLKRKGVFHPHTSVSVRYRERELHVSTMPGRLVRPLLIVEGGRVRMHPRTRERIQSRCIARSDLVVGFRADKADVPSLIEYLDADEIDTVRVAMELRLGDAEDGSAPYPPTVDYCEIHPTMMLGAIAGCIPFSDHNQSPRNTYQSAMCKQAMGVYVRNYHERYDSLANVLNYPSPPLVYTQIGQLVHQDRLPSGCPAIVAILTSSGYNQEDSIIVSREAIRRGFGHSTHYRTYRDEERKNGESGEDERFGRPNPDETRGMKLGSYEHLDERGFARVGAMVEGGDVIIGKTVQVRCDTSDKLELDLCTTLRGNDRGIVDSVLEARNGDGYRFGKVRTRSVRQPQIGDKFSSCHGQKGTIGSIIPEADMPYIADGNNAGCPVDIILNPHAIPTRMTGGQLYEMLFNYFCAEHVCRGDGTPFNREVSLEALSAALAEMGLAATGEHAVINGSTGQRLRCRVFVAPVQMQKLKHMVDDKIHSRSKGPVTMTTRQPTEGRSRDGGLRLGEMERDCIVAHGSAAFLKESYLERSDLFPMHVGDGGLVAAVNKEQQIYKTFEDGPQRCHPVVMPYASKLLGQELQAMNMAMRTLTTGAPRRAAGAAAESAGAPAAAVAGDDDD
jgi:DNA-directed RNA polymerase II subunit RPB2